MSHNLGSVISGQLEVCSTITLAMVKTDGICEPIPQLLDVLSMISDVCKKLFCTNCTVIRIIFTDQNSITVNFVSKCMFEINGLKGYKANLMLYIDQPRYMAYKDTLSLILIGRITSVFLLLVHKQWSKFRTKWSTGTSEPGYSSSALTTPSLTDKGGEVRARICL
jgi:hypothetical protein